MPHGYDSNALKIHDFRNIYVEKLRMLDIKDDNSVYWLFQYECKLLCLPFLFINP